MALSLACGRAETSGHFYLFHNVFSGTSPTGSPPWTTELFQDVAPGTVSLTVSNVGLTGSEFISDLYLNLNPLFDPKSLVITLEEGTPGIKAATISAGVDQFKADGDGMFDIHFNFSSGGADRFGPYNYLRYNLSGIAELTSADFGFTSASSAAPLLAAAHIIGSGGTSSWIAPSELTPIPEPAPLRLLLLAAASCLGTQRLLRTRSGMSARSR